LTRSNVSQHLFQLFDADVDSGLGFLLYNFVCFLSFVFVVQFVVVVGNVPATLTTKVTGAISGFCVFLPHFYACATRFFRRGPVLGLLIIIFFDIQEVALLRSDKF